MSDSLNLQTSILRIVRPHLAWRSHTRDVAKYPGYEHKSHADSSCSALPPPNNALHTSSCQEPNSPSTQQQSKMTTTHDCPSTQQKSTMTTTWPMATVITVHGQCLAKGEVSGAGPRWARPGGARWTPSRSRSHREQDQAPLGERLTLQDPQQAFSRLKSTQ